MPIMRNPFRKQDENIRPALATTLPDRESNDGAYHSQPIDIKEQPVEYKLSEINDSGVYLPPSPPERKSFWSTASSRSTTSSSLHRNAFNENDQFNISRESFDSYRRSFDISARSPIIPAAEARQPRASLDSRTFERPPLRTSFDSRALLPPPSRSSNSFQRPSQVPAETQEEAFEDVDIAEPKPQPVKKKGIFARMVDSSDHHHSERPGSSGDSSKTSWIPFSGRKRGQSGQGAELGSIPQREATPKPVDSQLKREVLASAEPLSDPVSPRNQDEETQTGLQELRLNGTPKPETQTPPRSQPPPKTQTQLRSQAPEVKVDS